MRPRGTATGTARSAASRCQGGTITLCRPRARGLEGRFESRVLQLFARRTAEVSNLLPAPCLHGLVQIATASVLCLCQRDGRERAGEAGRDERGPKIAPKPPGIELAG